MAISDKTRKLLWGRSGNRCAECRQEIVITSNNIIDNESIVGEECHIVSKQQKGPRYRINSDIKFYDSYENLILLCRVHHKMIDDQTSEYSEDTILKIKNKHEQWVKRQLEHGTIKPLRLRSKKGEKVDFLFRVVSGKQLYNIIDRADGAHLDHPDPESEYEVELFGDLLQFVSDYADMSGYFEPADRVKACFELTQQIKEIEEAGFWVFGNKELKILEGGSNEASSWSMAYINIIRNDSPLIINLSDAADVGKKS